MQLFDNLKYLRKTFNLNQKELGEIIGKSLQTISGYENGTAEPDINTLILLSKYFKTSIDDLIKMNLQENENYEKVVNEPPPQYEKPKPLITEDEVLRKQVELLMTEVKRLNQKIDLIEEKMKKK